MIVWPNRKGSVDFEIYDWLLGLGMYFRGIILRVMMKQGIVSFSGREKREKVREPSNNLREHLHSRIWRQEKSWDLGEQVCVVSWKPS